MSEVVTTLTIDSDTSGADRFSRAMDSAGSSAQSGASSVQAMTLAVAGVAGATVAALAAVRGFVDFVGKQSQALAEMSDHADLAGMSIKHFQETMFAAMSAGVSEKDFATGLDKISSDLTEASRGATMFGKLMEQNGISIKNANGQLVSTKQALSDIANLMQQATPGQQQAIAKIVGLSASWIPFLKQGADAIDEQKKKAADLGIIIDDSTIEKAKEFNREWHTATAAWDLQFKAALASILPQMIQLANIAKDLINGIGSFASDFTRLFTPVDQMSMPQLDAQINSLHKFRDTLDDIEKSGQKQGVSEGILERALGLPAGASISDVDKMIDDVSQRMDKLNSRLRVTAPGAGINLPDLNSEKDALERAIDQIDKHIDRMKADTLTVGENISAQVAARTEADLYAAALRARKTDLEKYADQFADLGEKAGAAALDLEKANVASHIKFGAQTALLSPEDVQIAQQLKALYPDVATALGSVEASAIRTNNRIKDIKDTAQQFTSDLVHGLISGQTAMQAMPTAARSLAAALAAKPVSAEEKKAA